MNWVNSLALRGSTQPLHSRIGLVDLYVGSGFSYA
jgi:hypothetical protein